MFEKTREKARRAEEFLRGIQSPPAPPNLREFGLQRITARAFRAPGEKGERRYLRHPAHMRRVVAVPLAALLLLAGGTSGLYAASANALPGSALYGSKIFFERARLAFTASSSSDAVLEMKYCERRVEELRRMLVAGDSGDWERWLREYRRNLSRAELLLETLPESESRNLFLGFESTLSEQAEFLEEVLAGAPEASYPYLEEAYAECQGRMMRVRMRCGMGGENGCQGEGRQPPADEGAGDPQRQGSPGGGGGPGSPTVPGGSGTSSQDPSQEVYGDAGPPAPWGEGNDTRCLAGQETLRQWSEGGDGYRQGGR